MLYLQEDKKVGQPKRKCCKLPPPSVINEFTPVCFMQRVEVMLSNFLNACLNILFEFLNVCVKD
jgi:hypothetical protein